MTAIQRGPTQEASIDFQVAQRPVMVEGVRQPLYKGLVRKDTGECFSVVRDTYRVIQNRDMIKSVEANIKSAVGAKEAKNVEVTDRLSGGGRFSMREWVFPGITAPSTKGSKSDIAFRVIGINRFGDGALKSYYGAIDFFCLNGMVTGEHDIIRLLHTGSYSVEDRMNPIADCIEQFHIQGKTWKEWQAAKLKEEAGKAYLQMAFAKQLAAKILQQYQDEIAMRGATVWALYSAMTCWSSNLQKFPMSGQCVNVTGQLHDRQMKVAKLVTEAPWKTLAAG